MLYGLRSGSQRLERKVCAHRCTASLPRTYVRLPRTESRRVLYRLLLPMDHSVQLGAGAACGRRAIEVAISSALERGFAAGGGAGAQQSLAIQAEVAFAGYRAADRLSAPRGETLLLSPPQPIEHFMASARARVTVAGALGASETLISCFVVCCFKGEHTLLG